MRVARRALLAGIPATLIAPRAWAARAGNAIAPVVDAAASAFLKATPQAAGLSIGVVRGGEEHRAHFGSLVRGGAVRPDSRTIYPLASISKTFTGFLLAEAVVAGRVGLDDDIRAYLDGDYPNLVFDGQPIRMWHLLNHNSGLPFRLPDIPETRPPFPEASDSVRAMLAGYDREAFLRDLHDVKLARAPGTGFSYSNASVTLLSYILERVYRRPFDALIRARIAGPIGARDTAISLNAAQSKRLARGYDEQGRIAPPPEDSMLGAAAIKSTTDDMLRYVRWQMAEGNAALKLCHAPHPIDGKFAMGLNWQMMIDGARRRIWQDGTIPGSMSMCAMLPHARTGLVAFANQLDRESIQGFHRMAEAILIGLEPGSADLF